MNVFELYYDFTLPDGIKEVEVERKINLPKNYDLEKLKLFRSNNNKNNYNELGDIIGVAILSTEKVIEGTVINDTPVIDVLFFGPKHSALQERLDGVHYQDNSITLYGYFTTNHFFLGRNDAAKVYDSYAVKHKLKIEFKNDLYSYHVNWNHVRDNFVKNR